MAKNLQCTCAAGFISVVANEWTQNTRIRFYLTTCVTPFSAIVSLVCHLCTENGRSHSQSVS